MKQLKKHLLLFLFGGIAYVMIELAWRGRSHWSMFILGGICFVAIGLINELFPWDLALWKQMTMSAVLVTTLELITGILVNIILKWDVWDYTNLPMNFLGQICIPFSILWFLLAIPVILVDDYLRWKWFGEEKPRYKLW